MDRNSKAKSSALAPNRAETMKFTDRISKLLMQILIGCFVLSFFACGSRSVTVNDLFGTYHVEHKDGKETLTLQKNLSYLQLYAKANGTTITNVGAWKFFPPGPNWVMGGSVSVNDALVVDRNSDTLATNKADISMYIFATKRTIQLRIGSEGEISYDMSRKRPEGK